MGGGGPEPGVVLGEDGSVSWRSSYQEPLSAVDGRALADAITHRLVLRGGTPGQRELPPRCRGGCGTKGYRTAPALWRGPPCPHPQT
jgi:hypothetical protein